MDILLANPRGFCAGVDRAIEIVKRAIETLGAPIYVRHEVVHNKFVVDDLKARGAIFVEELDEVPDGNTVIFDSFRPGTAGSVVHLFTATRSNVAVDFQPANQLNTEPLIQPALTKDGSLLYAANLSFGRLSRMEKVGNGFGAPQSAAIPSTFSVCSPVTNDDLTIFLALGDTTGNEIIVTQRPSLADPFPEPTQVVELKTSATIAEPSWLSPDGCRLYLTYGGGAGEKTTIHVATRPQ